MNRNPWAILGIPFNSDIKSIKRAYAEGLRATRPDDDPAGFQALTDAYEFALASARRRVLEAEAAASGEIEAPGDREASDETDVVSTGVPEATAPHELSRLVEPVVQEAVDTPATIDVSVEAKQEQQFLFEPFFEALKEQMKARNALLLREWLESHPDLYSLELKWALIPPIFDALARNAPDIDPKRNHIETLERFFGVDARIRRHPSIAHALDYLEAGAWRSGVLPAQAVPGMSAAEAFQQRLSSLRRREEKLGDRMILNELLQSPSQKRRLFILLFPTFSQRLGELLAQIRSLDPEQAASRLNPEATAYWDGVLAPDRIDRRRMLAVGLQCLVFIAALACISILAAGFVIWPMVLFLGGQILALWLIYALGNLLTYRFRAWKARRAALKPPVKAEPASKGAAPLAGSKPRTGPWDSFSTVSASFVGLALVGPIMQVLTDDATSDGGLLGLFILLIPAALLSLAGGRLRVEAIFLMICATILGWKLLYFVIPKGHGSETATVCLAACMAVLLALLMDHSHASSERLSAPEARKEKNFHMWIMGIILIGVIAYLPSTDPPETDEVALEKTAAAPVYKPYVLPTETRPSEDSYEEWKARLEELRKKQEAQEQMKQ